MSGHVQHFIPSRLTLACLLAFFPLLALGAADTAQSRDLTLAPIGYAASIATHMWINADTFAIPIT